MSEGRRIVLALVLSVSVIFVWQKFFSPPVAVEPVKTSIEDINKSGSIEPTSEASKKSGPIEPDFSAQVELYKLSANGVEFTIDSTLKVTDIGNDQAKFPFKDIVGGDVDPRVAFKIQGANKFTPLFFQKISQNADELVLESSETGIVATYKIATNGTLNLNLSGPDMFELKFYINSSEKKLDSNEVRSFVVLKKALVKHTVGEAEKDGGEIKWFGLDFHYHLFAVVFDSKQNVNFSSNEDGLFQVETKDLFSGEDQFATNLSYIFTLKNYDTLAGLGNNLDLSVDFGIWSVLSVPMLKALKFFYTFLGNWGLAIIFLTLCMRLLTFPLQYKSFKSMKNMQLIQPKLKEINEKYKDDAQKKQMETMALFKKEGVNPLGGCLPMLFQFPIFIAFYRMLGAAVELVGAPFYFWLTDLSQKDPYYVLPVIVTLVMLLQQKLTPTTTTDPTQQKIMMFMPLIFGFILKDLPSGLNLYIFVSTALGIILQKAVFARKTA